MGSGGDILLAALLRTAQIPAPKYKSLEMRIACNITVPVYLLNFRINKNPFTDDERCAIYSRRDSEIIRNVCRIH